jgi:chromatin remodeling complex protein RSC6
MTEAKKKTSAFMKPVRATDELAAVLGTSTPMPRTEVMKKLWDYIKKHKLQDPQNKRNIIPDQKLAKVFGSTQPINMFKMTSKVSTHLQDAALAHK